MRGGEAELGAPGAGGVPPRSRPRRAGPGAVGFCTELAAGAARGRVRVAARPCRWPEGGTSRCPVGIAAEGRTEKATASPAAAASCSGVRDEKALKAHGQRLPPAGGASCQPVTFSAFIFSCYFLVCKGENEAPVAQSLTWSLFPAGVSSPQVTDSACTGCPAFCSRSKTERVSCRSFLRAPQERRRGRFLTQLRPCHARDPQARQQPLFPRRRGAAPPPPPRSSGCLFTHPGPARGGAAPPHWPPRAPPL